MTQALYRKWRPQAWDEVVGQEHVIQTLLNAVKTDRVGHAYLFSGPRGTGKTTAARLLAKAVNCLAPDKAARPCNQCDYCKAVNENRFMDLIEIDAASNTSVEDVRDLRDKINFSPTQGQYKIYIIDEVHMLSTAAFNALLKTLEEPPPHAIFILATTEIHKIPATVLSRCQRHEFRRVPLEKIITRLDAIVKAESLQADDAALTLIARQSAGGLRDAISLLDQLASTGERITLELAQTVLGTATSQTVLALVQSISARDPAEGLNAIHRALDSGTDPRALARQIVEYLRALMLIQMGNGDEVETTADIRAQMEQHAQALAASEVLRNMRLFNTAAADTRGGWQPSLSLELAFAEALEIPAGQGMAMSTPEPVPAHKAEPKPARSSPASTATQPTRDSSSVKQSEQPPQPAPAADFGLIRQNWKKVSAHIKPTNPNLTALLNSSHPVDVRDGVLIIGISSDVLFEKISIPENLRITQQAIAAVIGVDIPIQFIVHNAKNVTRSDIKQDGMVAAALDNGGEIVDMQ
jgi:DNA polymerase-3 subunit gamma/tau